MQFRGVAPAANIVGVKVLDSTGQGRASSVIAGIAWAIAHKDEYNIRVLNLSIGSNPVAPDRLDPIAKAVEAAWKNGIAVVCAAGNEGEFGPGGILSPGNEPLRHHRRRDRHAADRRPSTTTRSPPTAPSARRCATSIAKPDLVAPGNRLDLAARARAPTSTTTSRRT